MHRVAGIFHFTQGGRDHVFPVSPLSYIACHHSSTILFSTFSLLFYNACQHYKLSTLFHLLFYIVSTALTTNCQRERKEEIAWCRRQMTDKRVWFQGKGRQILAWSDTSPIFVNCSAYTAHFGACELVCLEPSWAKYKLGVIWKRLQIDRAGQYTDWQGPEALSLPNNY